MYETGTELAELQALLEESLAQSTAHLRSIVRPGERTLTAGQLVNVLTGMCTLALSSVTARCEPRVSGADGHFLHARWIITTERSSAKPGTSRRGPRSAWHICGAMTSACSPRHGAGAEPAGRGG